VRRGFEPILDVPVTIRNPDQPIGTHVVTAMATSETDLRWSVVSINDALTQKVRSTALTFRRMYSTALRPPGRRARRSSSRTRPCLANPHPLRRSHTLATMQAVVSVAPQTALRNR
jgi:hypothetical protein